MGKLRQLLPLMLILLQLSCGQSIECRKSGLHIDGELAISSVDGKVVGDACEESSFKNKGSGYYACCDGHCCQWYSSDLAGLLAEGQKCSTTAQCQKGLKCMKAQEGFRCGRLDLGADCTGGMFCQEGLYCGPNPDAKGPDSICIEALDVEGAPCQVDLNMCAPPLRCVASYANVGSCRNGSYGDPCNTWQSDACQEGLYCGDVGGDNLYLCRDGRKGDPCGGTISTDVCQSGTDCMWKGQGRVCMQRLTMGEPCNQPGEINSYCSGSLLCHKGYTPSKCMPQSVEGEPCTVGTECVEGLKCKIVNAKGSCVAPLEEGGKCSADSDCAEGLRCSTASSLCQAGSVGQPCLTNHDCLYPMLKCHTDLKYCVDGNEGSPCQNDSMCAKLFHCMPGPDEDIGTVCLKGVAGTPCLSTSQCEPDLVCLSVEGVKRCVTSLLEGDVCDPESIVMACAVGLVCNTNKLPYVCDLPGIELSDCSSDEECKTGHKCVLSAGKCYDGSKGDPCDSSAQCTYGLFCLDFYQECQEGILGDPCVSLGDCKEPYLCDFFTHLCVEKGQ